MGSWPTVDDCPFLKQLIEQYGCARVESIDLEYNPERGNKGLVKTGLLGTLARLQNLRERWLASTGLDDTLDCSGGAPVSEK